MLTESQRWRAAFFILAVSGFAPGAGSAQVHADEAPVTGTVEGPQFLGADAKGHVKLLEGSDLRVFPVNSDGTLGDPEDLKPFSDMGPARVPLAASLGPGGDAWLLQTFMGADSVRLFRSGKEAPVAPAGWRITTVGWIGSDPAVVVAPMRPGGNVSLDETSEPPLLLELPGREWRAVLREPVELSGASDPFKELMAAREFLLAPGSRNTLWIAPVNRYRIRHLSPTGKVRTSIEVGNGQMEFRARNKAETARLDEMLNAAKARGQRISIDKDEPVVKKVIEGIAEAPDGKLYILLKERSQGEKHLAQIDRYDPVRGVLERTEVDLPSYSGRRSMVAGRTALHVANFKASSGRWLIPWDRLEKADWKAVEDAEIH